MINEFAFKRDNFTGLWYFGSDEKYTKMCPCSQYEYDLAKNGVLSERLLRNFKPQNGKRNDWKKYFKSEK